MRASVIAVLILFASSLFAEPVSQKAKERRYQNLHDLAYLQVPLTNFGTEDLKKQYDEMKEKYEIALAFYLEDNFLEAYKGFVEVQTGLEKLYEDLSLIYIDRTQEVLRATTTRVVDIELQYHPSSQKIVNMLKAREAPHEGTQYSPEEYHLVYDKHPIVKHLDRGYEFLGESKRIRQEAMDLEKWLEEGKEIDPSMRKRRIDAYKASIESCRSAKKSAIHVFHLLNRNDIYSVQVDHAENYYAKYEDARLAPVLDPRIPDEYKIDASDALNRDHAEEVRTKLNNENIKKGEKTENKTKS